MNLTPSQQVIYNMILSMNSNGPLTDDKRALLLSVDMTEMGLTRDDKLAAIRHYEHIIGLTIQAL
jgi:hypothetical protein